MSINVSFRPKMGYFGRKTQKLSFWSKKPKVVILVENGPRKSKNLKLIIKVNGSVRGFLGIDYLYSWTDEK